MKTIFSLPRCGAAALLAVLFLLPAPEALPRPMNCTGSPKDSTPSFLNGEGAMCFPSETAADAGGASAGESPALTASGNNLPRYLRFSSRKSAARPARPDNMPVYDDGSPLFGKNKGAYAAQRAYRGRAVDEKTADSPQAGFRQKGKKPRGFSPQEARDLAVREYFVGLRPMPAFWRNSLAVGGPPPRGAAVHRLPSRMARHLPLPIGYEWLSAGNDLVLVDRRGGENTVTYIVYDVFK